MPRTWLGTLYGLIAQSVEQPARGCVVGSSPTKVVMNVGYYTKMSSLPTRKSVVDISERRGDLLYQPVNQMVQLYNRGVVSLPRKGIRVSLVVK